MIQINVHCRYNNNLIKFHDYWLAKMLFHHCELLSHESSSESLYKYKGKSFKVKWGNQITPEEDSINILPFGFKNVNEFARLNQQKNRIWYPLVITGERIFKTENEPYLNSHLNFQNHIDDLKNHKIYSDNITLREDSNYNNEFLLTNTYFGWMHKLNMRLMYEYKNIYDRLNFKYKIGYFIYRRTNFRTTLINLLNENKDVFVSQYVDPNVTQYEPLENIQENKLHSDNDFEDLLNTKFFITNDVYWSNLLDMYFRNLLEAQVYIIDETYSEFTDNFSIINLSEKTYLPLLSGIPFLSTHSYPLEAISKILDVELHPFYDDIKESQGDANKINTFITNFLKNFDENVTKCITYSEMIRNKYSQIIASENSLMNDIFKKYF
jgi:hypothetical protein